MPNNVDVDASVALYRRRLGPDDRYASFDYCYNYFQSFREQGDPASLANETQLQTSCLQLGFYLASWGMLRGSSVLLKRSTHNFIPVIEAIATMSHEVWNIDTDDYSLVQREVLLEAIQRIRNAFPEPGPRRAESLAGLRTPRQPGRGRPTSTDAPRRALGVVDRPASYRRSAPGTDRICR